MKRLELVVFKSGDHGKSPDWTIRAGLSRFLIASGPGHTVALGHKLAHELRWPRAVATEPMRKRRK